MNLIVQFLSSIREFVLNKNGRKLGEWLQVEPTASEMYFKLGQELRSQFRDANAVEKMVEECFPDDDMPNGQPAPWPSFVSFMREYVMYWRDADFTDLPTTHEHLCTVTNACSTAFAHPENGSMLLQTCMSLGEALSRLTLQLNKRPDLIMKKQRRGGSEERKTITEICAEILQKIFTTCLTDRSSVRHAKPEGKKVGVYQFANLTLKLLFACHRKQLAQQIFTNIESNSSPLHLYPAAQRVTFLYYLGRFWLSNNSYMRASLALEEAYLQMHKACVTHRALILSYLIPCNILIGKLPSHALLQRPEAQELTPLYGSLCQALKTGDIPRYQTLLALHKDYLVKKGVHATLAYDAGGILWRSLARRVFILTYRPPAPNDESAQKKAALLDLDLLLGAAKFLQRKIESAPPYTLAASAQTKNVNNTHLLPSSSIPINSNVPRLLPHEGVISGNQPITYKSIELLVSSLIDMDLMHGYISHSLRKFAVLGAKGKDPVVVGWPPVASAIRDRHYDEDFDLSKVPGWVKT